MEISKVVIFGTGKKGREIYGVLKHAFSLDEIVFIDNHAKSKMVLGIPVFSALDFLKKSVAKEYTYVIGGRFLKDMYEQLIQAGIVKESIYSVEQFIQRFLVEESLKYKKNETSKELIVFDCSDGFVLGGAERWTYQIAKEFLNHDVEVLLYTNNLTYAPPRELEDKVLYVPFEEDFSNMKEQLQYIRECIECYSKVTFVAAHIALYFSVALLMKKINSEQRIRIISVVHSSLEEKFWENIFAFNEADVFMCVNSVMAKRLGKEDKIRKKVFYKETPIQTRNGVRTYSNSDMPIYIGYAARLEVVHKRSDLLCVFLDELEKRSVNYVLEIAGEGTCFNMLCEYVEANGLQEKVKLLGRLEYDEMLEFWWRQDVAINLSETEGCSLSMLESMAAGVVNVITHTPGSEDFVVEGQTGFLVPIGDMKQMAEIVLNLEKKKEMLPIRGNMAKQLIEEKCSIKDYIDFWEKYIL